MNDTANDSCGLPFVLTQIKNQAYFIVFYVMTPIYFLVGFSGHVLLIIGFVKRAKTDPGYTYQIYLTIVKTMEILFFTSFVIACKWFSGMEVKGEMWFQRNYALMKYAAHAAVPMQNSCITTSLLMAVAMAADRVFALWRPFVYKTIDHKWHRVMAVVSCVSLGWSSSVFDWFRFRLEFTGDYYVVVVNSAYVGSLLARILANLRNAIRALGVVTLIVCNVAIVVLYRRKALVKASLTQAVVSVAEEKRKSDRKSSERALTIIVIGQSICITLSVGMFVAFYSIAYAQPSFSLCASGILFACFMDGMLEVGDLTTFALVAGVDKKVRNTISMVFARKKNQNQIQAVTVSMEPSQMPSQRPSQVPSRSPSVMRY